MPEKMEVSPGFFKAACGCRWTSKGDCLDNPENPSIGWCAVHTPPPPGPEPLATAATATRPRDAAPDAYDPPPDHYSTGAGIDPWQVWDAFGLDKDAYLANAVKYILRAGKKDIAPRLDDLVKARNYINKAIEKERSQ